MKFTTEQEEFRSALIEFIKAEKLSEEAREIYDNKKSFSDSSAYSKFIEFGAFDFFADQENNNFTELAIIAEECGRNLIAGDIPGALFWGPYFLKVLKNTQQNNSLARLIDETALSEIHKGIKTVSAFFVNNSSNQHALSPSGLISKDAVYFALNIQQNDTNFGNTEEISSVRQTNINFKSPELIDRTQSICKLYNASETPPESSLKLPNLFLYHRYLLLKAFECYGTAQKAFSMTLEYVKTRKQFGVTIGSFQAVQHQLADSYLLLEQIRGLITFALKNLEGSYIASNPKQTAFELNSAVKFTFDNVCKIIETAIQLHGGIGFTWEYDLHFYLRRAKLIEGFFGKKVKAEDILRVA